MTIDPYALCPGGTGKKIKFCCADLVGDLDKIQTMLEAEQRAACLELIDKLETKTPGRACLMSIKAMLLANLGESEKAEATLKSFQQKFPDNPVALAETALMIASRDGALAAIEPAQKALELYQDPMPIQLYDVLGAIGRGLIGEEEIFAARGHLLLQLSLSGGKDREPLELFTRIDRAPEISPLIKQDPVFASPPEGVAWKGAFDAALALAHRGAWSAASERLYELVARVGDSPALWQNLALLRLWLADTAGGVRALRKFAAQPMPLEDAVEAEALAQLLDDAAVDMVDLVMVEYPITDMDKLLASLASTPTMVKSPQDLSRLGDENTPPPRGVYWLLDKPLPASGAGITREQISSAIAQVFVFGRQTDREARLELIAYRGEELTESQQALAAIVGDAVGAVVQEGVAGQATALRKLLSWNWRLPGDTPPATQMALADEEYRKVLLEKWPNLPQKLFGGKTPHEAASDPAQKIKLLAAVLLLELGSRSPTALADHNALRTALGLPTNDPIEGEGLDVVALPLARLSRLAPAKLSDEQLEEAYQRASHYGLVVPVRELAAEVIRRPSLDGKIEKARVYGQLAELEADAAQALAYLDLARKAAEAIGKSSAPWDISELALRIELGDVAGAESLMQHLRAEHIREPGVAQALYQVLMQAGVIGPDGQPMGEPAAAAPGIMLPGAAPSEPGKIWTPGSDAPAAGKKSAIWTP